MNRFTLICVAIATLFTAACSEDYKSSSTANKPTHVWSDQVNNLREAQDVAKFVDEQQKQQGQRLRDLDVVGSQ